NVQFGLSVRDPQIADNPAVSTSEGFESDNDASGSTKTPQTSAIFSNITLIGPYRGNTASTIATGYRRGARIRKNSALRIYNSIFMDHKNGLHIDGVLSVANAVGGSLKFNSNIVAGNATGKVLETTNGFPFANEATWFAVTSKNDSVVSSANILTTPYNYTAPDYRPAVGSIALTGADFTDIIIDAYVLKAPTASNVAYCKGATAAALTATAGLGNTLWWYTAATGGSGSTTAPTPSTSSVGVTTYYVSQSEIYGGESARTAVTVTINALPVATITAKGSTSLCTGSSVVLKSSSATGNVWSTTATADSIVVSSSGAYTVTVTDGNNCVATSSATVVNVSSAPLPTVSLSGATTFCEGDSLILTSSTANSYQWANSAGATKSITVKTSGTYHVTTTNTDACAGVGQSADIVVTVGTVPVAAGSYTSNGAVVTFTNTSSGATSYTWDFDDFSTSTANAPVHAFAANGVYKIVLTAWKGTCSDTATMTFKLALGVSEIALNKGTVSIYPNPVNEQATFELNMTESSNVTVSIYDVAGQLVANVYQGQVTEGTTKLSFDSSNLRSGIYFTSITSENTQKIVKMIVE
ncbi:MAG: T9SS type A sorting domain-containing protein, partial [Bacteroidetes bacterium]|nr:T9SS type A sorting domain-containing protein [Bacteroidota bacterium]